MSLTSFTLLAEHGGWINPLTSSQEGVVAGQCAPLIFLARCGLPSFTFCQDTYPAYPHGTFAGYGIRQACARPLIFVRPSADRLCTGTW